MGDRVNERCGTAPLVAKCRRQHLRGRYRRAAIADGAEAMSAAVGETVLIPEKEKDTTNV